MDKFVILYQLVFKGTVVNRTGDCINGLLLEIMPTIP